jgi:hypothetical protein
VLHAYEPTVEQHMKYVYEQLSEKDRRLYAAVEAPETTPRRAKLSRQAV